MTKKFGKLAILIFAFTLFMILLEIVNYLSQTNSASSIAINNFLITNAANSAQKNDFKATDKLHWASNVNTYGEFDPYRKLLRKDYSEKIQFPDDQNLRSKILEFLAKVKNSNFKDVEDQGLGFIYYKMAQIAYQENQTDLTIKLLKKAMYNYPEFASFHGELINLYFKLNDRNNFEDQLEYCFKFKKAELLCKNLQKDIFDYNTAQEFGYLNSEVEKHYLHEPGQ